MALQTSARVLKTILFIVNSLCLMMGVVCLIVSSFIFIKHGKIHNLPEGMDSYSLAYLLLIVGLITFVFSSIGTYGTWREVCWIIGIYAFFMFCLVFVQTFVVGYTIHHKHDFVKGLGEFLHVEFGNGTVVSDDVKDIQQKYMCCGVDGPSFWHRIENGTLPVSCCEEDGDVKCEMERAFKRGCFEVLTFYYMRIKNYFCGVSLGLVSFEMFALISSVILLRDIRRRSQIYEQLY